MRVRIRVQRVFGIRKNPVKYVVQFKNIFAWQSIKHGDFWPPCRDEDEGVEITFPAVEEAKSWVAKTFDGIFKITFED